MKIVTIIISLVFISSTKAISLNNVVIVIFSQMNKYNEQLAFTLKNSIVEQAANFSQMSPIIYLSHKDFPHMGGWTFLPILPQLILLHKNNCKWFIFLTEYTHVNLNKFLHMLDKYDARKEIWFSYGLYDREAVITHHFAFYENPSQFLYPNLASGVVISIPLLKKLAQQVVKLENNEIEFSIDSAHELAMFIWDKGKGIKLTHEPSLCTTQQLDCASFVNQFMPCNEPVPNDSVYFSVKTYHKYHTNRVPVVRNTWAKHVSLIQYFSDQKDDKIPTIVLNVPNTEQGHCGKTMAIIRYASAEMKNNTNIKWLVIVDDDTILSSIRLRSLLSCYNVDDDSNIALGERYGYKVANRNHGYNYITGGGGMVFNFNLVHRLSIPGVCDCPTNDTPDDMYLGVCLQRLGVQITHSPYFHQARPNDYTPEYLSTQYVVSFHKHWMIDPVSVYQTWFAHIDQDSSSVNKYEQKIEL